MFRGRKKKTEREEKCFNEKLRVVTQRHLSMGNPALKKSTNKKRGMK